MPDDNNASLSLSVFGTMKKEDIDSILLIEKEAFPRGWNYQSFLDELSCKYSYCYVIKTGNGLNYIVAYICFRIIIDEMHILKIAVDSKWQNRGIGSLLLTKAFETAIAQGASISLLEVRPSNIPAIKLYEKFGFQEISKRSGYYPETGENALVFMKQLKEEKNDC